MTDWRRTEIKPWMLFALPAAIAVVAVADGAAEVIGWGFIAIAVTIAISLVFLEVGRSEDRARAREERLGGRR